MTATRLDAATVKAQLTEADVKNTFLTLGVERLTTCGPTHAKGPSPLRADSGRNPSFNVEVATGNWRDHATGESGDIFEAVKRARNCTLHAAIEFVVGIMASPPQSRPAPPVASNGRRSPVVATYEYRDADGSLAFSVERTADKQFFVRRPDGSYGYGDVKRVPYRLPEFPTDTRKWLLHVEGEKDADAARERGYSATTSPNGSNNWRDALKAHYRGLNVAIVPDNDQPGLKYALAVAASLYGIAARVKIVELPGLGPRLATGGTDLSDWFDAGHNAIELNALIAAAPDWTPHVEPEMPPETFGSESDDSAKAPQPLRSFGLEDTGNAERLVYKHGRDIRYNRTRRVWLLWNGTYWQDDAVGQIEQLAKQTALSIKDEAEALESEQAQKVLRWASSSLSEHRRSAMVRLAQSEPGIPVLPHQLDTDPFLLNVRNGTINLRTGKRQPHSRDDLITRVIDVDYDAEAICPRFDTFLSRVLGNDPDLIAYVWGLIGYSLTGDTREQVLIIAYGAGDNGKSTLLNTLRDLLGPFARSANADTFMEQKGGAIREDIADLDGARFVAASESEDGRRLNEALVKKMTGGERLRARRVYENGWEFDPQFTVWLATNHRPEIRGSDHAIWRRIRLIPFSVRISEEEKDKGLSSKLRVEFPGILAKAVRACLEWQAQGLQEPAAVRAATSDYRRDMDILGHWMNDRCLVGPKYEAPARALYDDYLAYCDREGYEPINQNTFGRRLTDHGCTDRKANGIRHRTGIALRGT